MQQNLRIDNILISVLMICKFMPQSCGHLRVVYRSNLFFDIDIEDVNFDAPQIEECINFHLRLFIEQFNRDSL